MASDTQGRPRISDLLTSRRRRGETPPVPRPPAGGGPAPVVVGTDGSASGLDALDWAAAEAASRGRPLRIVHALNWPMAHVPLGTVVVEGIDQQLRAVTETILRDAEDRARTIATDLQVTSRLLVGAAIPTMLGQARDAELLILGTRPRPDGRGLPRRSISAHVAANAPCPVVVVRPFRSATPGPSVARVVVSVDVPAGATRALGFAFHAAAQRGVGLTAVHAGVPAGSATATPRRGTLDDQLAYWRRRFPDVDIAAKPTEDAPGPALIAESAGAALLVINAAGRGGLRGMPRGSVGAEVLAGSRCPVAVIHPRATR